MLKFNSIGEFTAACPQCTVDFVPIHWYDVSASNFQTYVENFHAQTGLDIWVSLASDRSLIHLCEPRTLMVFPLHCCFRSPNTLVRTSTVVLNALTLRVSTMPSRLRCYKEIAYTFLGVPSLGSSPDHGSMV